MGLHFFYTNVTLEMSCCSTGTWEVMHLIASAERCAFVCGYLCPNPSFMCMVFVLSAYPGVSYQGHWATWQVLPWDPPTARGGYSAGGGVAVQEVQVSFPLNCHLNKKHSTPNKQSTVASPSGTKFMLLSLCWR